MSLKLKKLISLIFCLPLILQQSGLAQNIGAVDISKYLGLKPPIASPGDTFRPVHLRYLHYDSLDNSFKLFLDRGDAKNPKTQDVASTAKDLLNYFLVGISLPNDTFWVNLRPDSPHDIIDPLLAQTEVGRIFLESDLKLKKDTARATSPETPEGKEYWNRLYQKAGELYGAQNVTIPTLTRPWIIPDEIIIAESTDSAYVYKATLKVMLEQDYLKDSALYSFKDEREKQLNEYSSQIIRDNILPKLIKRINTSKEYAPLRQVYYSLILAQWFKARNQNKNTPYPRLIDRKDLTNLQSQIPYSVYAYFNAYKENFAQGEYNIKEPISTAHGQVIRSYFSGGIALMRNPGYSASLSRSGGSPSENILPARQPIPAHSDKNLPLIEVKETGPGGELIFTVLESETPNQDATKDRESASSPIGGSTALTTGRQDEEDKPFADDHKFQEWLKNLSAQDLRNEIQFLGSLNQLRTNRESTNAHLQEKATGDIQKLARRGAVIDLSISGKIVPEQLRYYYLRLLEILKDNPLAAYQIFNWDFAELLELFHILDYFVEGVTLDSIYEEEPGWERFLEQGLINSALPLFNNPKAFISHLRQKIKTTISDNSIRLAIKVRHIASVNAARGLIKALGLDKDNVIILYDEEIDSERARMFFPGYAMREFAGYGWLHKGEIRIEFNVLGNMKINPLGDYLSAVLSYGPFKFNLPERVSEEELNGIRELLGLGQRKVIVIGSPSFSEFDEFIQSYNSLYGNLPYALRPLLIIGFRERASEEELRSLGSLSGQSIAVRSDEKAPLPNVANNNVLILNTAGELLRMYALGVAIVGHDRNIFEPASQKAAVLYFEGSRHHKVSWHYNRDAKEALVEAGAAQVFSRENLEKLVNDSDAAKEMAERGLKAVEAYRKKVQSQAEEFALQIIGARSQLRDKFIATSSPVILDMPEAMSLAIVSSPLSQRVKDIGKGGIDFRFLPIVTQSMDSLKVSIRAMPQSSLKRVNLAQEWSDIERLVNSGITPSAERLKDYLAASCFKGNLDGDKERIVSCIADILRIQEESCRFTDPILKDILVVFGSGRSAEELNAAFSGG